MLSLTAPGRQGRGLSSGSSPSGFLPGAPATRKKQRRKRREEEVSSLPPNFWTKFRRWRGGENNLLRGEVRVDERTLLWMLRKPSLTVQLPYTALDKRLPFPPAHLHSLGRPEPWSDAVMCECVCV